MPYIVHDGELIHGVGDTPKTAFADAKHTLEQARISILSNDEDSSEQLGSWMRATDLHTVECSELLFERVKNYGGACGWFTNAGLAVTRDEAP